VAKRIRTSFGFKTRLGISAARRPPSRTGARARASFCFPELFTDLRSRVF
jgi:hypothetical protein